MVPLSADPVEHEVIALAPASLTGVCAGSDEGRRFLSALGVEAETISQLATAELSVSSESSEQDRDLVLRIVGLLRAEVADASGRLDLHSASARPSVVFFTPSTAVLADLSEDHVAWTQLGHAALHQVLAERLRADPDGALTLNAWRRGSLIARVRFADPDVEVFTDLDELRAELLDAADPGAFFAALASAAVVVDG